MQTRLVWLVVAFVGCFFCISIFAEIPRINKTFGYTANQKNLAKINTSQTGVLVTLSVKDHEKVYKGQILGETTSERYTQNRRLDEDQAQLAIRKIDLAKTELINVKYGETSGLKATQMRINTAQFELSGLLVEINIAKQRFDDLSRQMERQKELVAQGFVSAEAVETKRGEWLQQKLNLSALARTKVQLEREIATQTEELSLVASRAQSQRSQLMRDMTTSQQEFNEHSSKRIQLIAPIDGVVTQLSASVGQTVRPDIPIMTIVPEGSAAEVLLLVPSRSIGFIRVGQKVSVRYQAYPHEHYGRHYGVVKEVATAALAPQEVVQHIRVDEPTYTVRVSLPANYLAFQGKQLPLSPGMVVEADVELDRLKIYQWLLEPLYRLGGRI